MTLTRTILTFLLALTLSAEEPKTRTTPTVEQLQAAQAEIESLTSQLAEMQITFQYSQRICRLPDVMQAIWPQYIWPRWLGRN